MSGIETIRLPHLLKSASFAYEQEIRFVLGANHKVVNAKKGVMISIDAYPMIAKHGVTVSEQLQLEERTLVHETVNHLIEEWRLQSQRASQDEKRRPALLSGLSLSKEWVEPYEGFQPFFFPDEQAVAQPPFPTQDKVPGLFEDLD